MWVQELLMMCAGVNWQQQEPDGHVVDDGVAVCSGLMVQRLAPPTNYGIHIVRNAPAARSSRADAMLSKPGVGSSRRVGSCVYKDCLLEPEATTSVLLTLLIGVSLHAAMPEASACTAAGGTLLATFSRLLGK
jgi:hypothetical protein